MNNNWIYIGIFLDDKSKKQLKKLYPLPEAWKIIGFIWVYFLMKNQRSC